MSSPWDKWYIANDDWGDLSHHIWQWMEKVYDKEKAEREASQYRGYVGYGGGGGGYAGYGGGGGASLPKSPKSVQSWKNKADEIIQYWHDKYDQETAQHLQPKFEQWIKQKYEKQKVNGKPHPPPDPRLERRYY